MRNWHQIKVLQNTAENLTAQAFCGQCCSVSEMVTDGTRNSRSGIHGPLSLLRYKNALSFKKCFANCERGSEWETTPKAPKHFCLNTQGCLETILWMIKQKIIYSISLIHLHINIERIDSLSQPLGSVVATLKLQSTLSPHPTTTQIMCFNVKKM